MTWTSRAAFENLTIVTAASLTTSYVAVLTTANPVVMFMVKNGTNGDVLVSFDGVNNKLGFPGPSGAAYDIKTNSPTVSQLMLPAGTVFYLKWNGTAPLAPAGNLYIELMEAVIT